MKNCACRNTQAALAKADEAKAMGTQPVLSDLLVEESWRQILRPEFQKPYWTKLQQFLHEEWASQKTFPPQHLIFRSSQSRWLSLAFLCLCRTFSLVTSSKPACDLWNAFCSSTSMPACSNNCRCWVYEFECWLLPCARDTFLAAGISHIDRSHAGQ